MLTPTPRALVRFGIATALLVMGASGVAAGEGRGLDFLRFSFQWHNETGFTAGVDLNRDGRVDVADLLRLIELPQHLARTEQLIAGLRVDPHTARIEAKHALRQHIGYEDLDLLHAALSHWSARIRWRSAWALAILAATESVQPLAMMLHTETETDGRAAACIALGETGASQAASGLAAAMFSDPEPQVRMVAAAALARVIPEHAAPSITAARSGEPESFVRRLFDWELTKLERGSTFAPETAPGQTATGALAGTKYLVYLPTNFNPANRHRVLVSVHGSDGYAEMYMDIVRQQAEQRGLVAIAPYFDGAEYPIFGNFSLRGIATGRTRSDLRLLEIVDLVASQLNLDAERFYLYGHSQGGQFAHRFVYAHPQRILRAVASGAGQYVRNDPVTAFPYGTKLNPFAPDLAARSLHDLVTAPLGIVVGTADTLERRQARDLFRAELVAYAAAHGLTLSVEFFDAPGVGHTGAGSWPYAIPFLFE